MWKCIFVAVLVLAHGAFCFDPTSWVLDTLRCSEHRVTVEPNRHLVETPEEFNHMCRQQSEFYSCLERVIKSVDLESEVELTTVLQYERTLFNELCSWDSPWRWNYLKNAHCINRQETDFCESTNFLSSCAHIPLSIREQTSNCIAGLLAMKCGIEAGQLFKFLMQLANDKCQSKMDYRKDSKSRHDNSKERVLKDLIKKMGLIPDQEEMYLSDLHTSVGDVLEESQLEEDMTDFSDIQDKVVSDSHAKNTEHDSETVENIFPEDYKSELLKSFEDVDENSTDLPIEDANHPYMDDHSFTSPENIFEKIRAAVKEGMSPAVPPILKKMYGGLQTWNPDEDYATVRILPNGRISIYNRHKGFSPLESMECGHFLDYFRCAHIRRSRDPRCLITTVYTAPTIGEFLPEEFDPEFGAELYETVPRRRYIFQQWVDKFSDTSDPLYNSSASVIEDILLADFPIDPQNAKINRDVRNSYVPYMGNEFTNENVFKPNLETKGLSDTLDLLDDLDVSERDDSSRNMHQAIFKSQSSAEKIKMLNQMFDDFTTVWPSISGTPVTSMLPKVIADSLENLYTYETGYLRNAEVGADEFGNFYMYFANQQNSIIDTITCGRVNECHPKGEGMWKCVIVPRYIEM